MHTHKHFRDNVLYYKKKTKTGVWSLEQICFYVSQCHRSPAHGCSEQFSFIDVITINFPYQKNP